MRALEARSRLRSQGLPRSWRVTRASDIRAVVGRGRHRGTQRLDFFWIANELGHPRFGVVVPHHGATAVARNRLRRRLREIARRDLMPRLGALDLVIRAHRSAYQARYCDLAEDLERWLQSVTDSASGRG